MKWRPKWLSRNTEMLMPNHKEPKTWLLYNLAGYAFMSQFVEGKIVLDVACGSGFWSDYMISKGAKTVIGGDITEFAIDYAANHYVQPNLYFILLNAEHMPFADNSIDVIVSSETIEHLAGYESFANECHRILKDEGLFVCRTPNRETASLKFGKALNSDHVKEFSPDDLHHLLADYFSDVVMYGQKYLLDSSSATKKLFQPLAMLAKLAWAVFPYQLTTEVIYFMANLMYKDRLELAKMEEMDKSNFNNVIDHNMVPYMLKKGSPVPGAVIALAKKGN